jgi:hypothetical protein
MQVQASLKDLAPKMPLPDFFDGTRSKLKPFLIQCDLYIGFNVHKYGTDTEKVLWASSLLKKDAFDWIEVYLSDHLENQAPEDLADREDETKLIFDNWFEFKKRLTRLFGDIDAQRTAERYLSALRQTGAATTYAAEFQRHAGRVDWNEDALVYQFYKGLKDDVKDDITRMEKRPEELQKMITAAILFDNRMYERRLERRGHYRKDHNKKKGKTQQPYWPQPMEVDATGKKPGPPRKKALSKEELQRRRDLKLCFECGKEGHRASFHKKGKQHNGPRQCNATGRRAYNKPANTQEVCVLERGKEVAGKGKGGRSFRKECREVLGEKKRLDLIEQGFLPEDQSDDEETLEERNIGTQGDRQAVGSGKRESGPADTYIDEWEPVDADDEDEGWVKEIPKQGIAEVLATKDEQWLDHYSGSIVKTLVHTNADLHMQVKHLTKELKQARGPVGQDVSEPSHPAHGQLNWTFCWDNFCSAHLEAKNSSGYFPHRGKPIIWKDAMDGKSLN